MPKYLRPNISAHSEVVPEPLNGSRTKSPSFVKIDISLSMNTGGS